MEHASCTCVCGTLVARAANSASSDSHSQHAERFRPSIAVLTSVVHVRSGSRSCNAQNGASVATTRHATKGSWRSVALGSAQRDGRRGLPISIKMHKYCGPLGGCRSAATLGDSMSLAVPRRGPGTRARCRVPFSCEETARSATPWPSNGVCRWPMQSKRRLFTIARCATWRLCSDGCATRALCCGKPATPSPLPRQVPAHGPRSC